MTTRAWRILTSIAVLAVAAIVAALLVGFQVIALPTRDVAEPAPGESPADVVRAFVDALDAHDCGTARALWASGSRDSADTWCSSVKSMSNVRVLGSLVESPTGSGRLAGDPVVGVTVTFDLRWRPFHDDGSMAEGPTSWSYLLTRESSSGPWRIFDQGMG